MTDRTPYRRSVANAPTSGDKGLKKDAIGFSDGLTIALASTPPPTRWRR
jgi:hypothetical protein